MRGKKNNWKDFALGMVIMALLAAMAVPALAAGVKTIEANYMDIKLVVDGVPVTPKDASGKAVEPFVYEGTTYLPVRAVGEALGKDVKWDGETKTVYIGEIPGKVNYLVDVCPPYEKHRYSEYHSSKAQFFKMGGKEYSNGFKLESGGYALINLDGKYSNLTFMAGHIDGEDMIDRTLEVYLDGEFSQSIDLKAEDSVKSFNIPLKHALTAKFVLSATGGGRAYGFAEAILG